jgi:hypothetical protein
MDYLGQFKGKFIGIMDWQDCHKLFDKLINASNDWYIYNTLINIPSDTAESEEFINQIHQIKDILNKEHKERYCGIVYVDNIDEPSFVKVFHPKNIGKACGGSENPPLPRWLISKTQPVDVMDSKSKGNESGLFSKLLRF